MHYRDVFPFSSTQR